MFIPKLEENILDRLCKEIYQRCSSNIEFIFIEDVYDALKNLKEANRDEGKGDFCIAIETLRYSFSVILSEVRQKKREIMSSLFDGRPELAKEKSVLKEKLDAVPEFAEIHMQEELLFQLIEHLQSIQNAVTYLFKEAIVGE